MCQGNCFVETGNINEINRQYATFGWNENWKAIVIIKKTEYDLSNE